MSKTKIFFISAVFNLLAEYLVFTFNQFWLLALSIILCLLIIPGFIYLKQNQTKFSSIGVYYIGLIVGVLIGYIFYFLIHFNV